MSDFISRQAAIDALGERPIVWDEWTDEYSLGQRNQYDDDKSAIEALPSAQPECKQECMPMYVDVSDCISRQQAIDALMEILDRPNHAEFLYTDEICKALEELPSAQPQRIRGRWVRKESDLSWWYECSECGESPLFDPYENEVLTPFCPWCGARMEEEEDAVD